MGESAVSSKKRRRRRRRRPWWQVLLRAGGLLAAVLAMLYATLPWWTPKRLLADRLARSLSDRLRLPVRIGRLEMSWREGLRLSDVRIGSPGGFGDAEMVTVGQLQCELAPLTMLFGGQPAWAELTGARLRVVVRPGGQVNLAALKPLIEMPGPGRVGVVAACAVIELPGRGEPLRLDVADLRYVARRGGGLRRITMSAALEQSGGSAPVTLLASAGEGHAAASCSFRFGEVDISELGLAKMLSLPLKRLEGSGSGRLEVQLNREGIVDEFRCSLAVRKLNAQPAGGPALPVIDKAEIAVDGVYDLYTRSLKMDVFRLHLPGIELAGSGRVHAEVLTGGWEGVRSLEVSGTVNPVRLAALLSGRPRPLPGGLYVDGRVEASLSLQGETSQLSFGVLLDATAAGIRAGGRPAKPPGRPLAVKLSGGLQRRTWQFALDRTELRIGENRFVGRGAMQNIRRVVAKWLRAGRAPTGAVAVSDLAGLDWQGSFHIGDLSSLRELLAPRWLHAVELDGAIDGTWSAEHADGLLLRGSLRLPGEASLRVGRAFAKRPGPTMQVDLAGKVAPDGREVRSLRLWTTLGPASFGIEHARVALSGAGARARVRAEGDFALRQVEDVLACLPRAGPWAKRVRGSAAGRFTVLLGERRRRVHVEVGATQLEARCGEAFAKSAGQPGRLVLDFRTDRAAEGRRRNRLAVRAELGSASADASAWFPEAGGAGRGLEFAARLRAPETGWLLRRCPALARALKAADPRGAMELSLSGTVAQEQWSGEVRCDGDDLQFRLPLTGGHKPRGSALRLRLAVRGTGRDAAVDLAGDLGRSSVRCAGTVRTATVAKLPPKGRYWPAPALAEMDLQVRARLAADRTVRALLPSLARRLAAWGVEGSGEVELRVLGRTDEIVVTGTADASGLTVRAPGTLVKPPGAAASARVTAVLPADLASVWLKDVFVSTPAAQLYASGRLPLLRHGDAEARAGLNVPDVERLAEMLPELRRYRPRGAAFLQLEVSRTAGREALRLASLKARDLAFAVAGRPCRLDGPLHLEDVSGRGKKLTIGRLATESLEWSVGRSHGFLIADLRNLARHPTGRFELLCTRLDAHELTTGSAAPPATAPAGKKKLTRAETAALSRRARRIVAEMSERLARASVRGRIRADQARYFDPAVEAFFDLQGVVARVRADQGRLRLGLDCGVNGGQVRQRYEVDLTGADARVAFEGDARQLQAAENVQRQLAQDFPGNTVHGTFSRTEQVSYSLEEYVMNALDARFAATPVGRARTVTTDGVLQGRAAPKFIARIFPGLNLATYRYQEMTAFAELLPDGTARNDMLFDGVAYDIYIEGTTDADRIGRYNTGVLLLPVKTSVEALHDLRQGRIPIFNFKARIENGRFYDQEVWYPLPFETAYVTFFKNNLLYRIWLVARQRKGASVIAPKPPAGGTGSEDKPKGEP